MIAPRQTGPIAAPALRRQVRPQVVVFVETYVFQPADGGLLGQFAPEQARDIFRGRNGRLKIRQVQIQMLMVEFLDRKSVV